MAGHGTTTYALNLKRFELEDVKFLNRLVSDFVTKQEVDSVDRLQVSDFKTKQDHYELNETRPQ